MLPSSCRNGITATIPDSNQSPNPICRSVLPLLETIRGHLRGAGDESKTDWWRSGRHSIQRWFHVGAYILLVPESFSKRVQVLAT